MLAVESDHAVLSTRTIASGREQKSGNKRM
jgi:hypothetical protein